MKPKIFLPLLLGFLFSQSALAQAEWVRGEVRDIGHSPARLSIQHAEITNLDLPPMRSEFSVADPALLTGLVLHSRIRFLAARKDGRFVVVRIDKN